MTTIVERAPGHYERHEEPYGESYVWCPECVVVECECGERSVLTPLEAVCGCGADHAVLLGKELASRRASYGAFHLWGDEHGEWWEKRDEYLRSESHYWRELRAVE